MRHAALILSLVLAAVVEPFASPAQAKTTDTCSVVSSADIEAALGEPVRKPQSETMGQSSTCRFLSTATPVKYLSVMVQHFRDDDPSSSKISDSFKRMLGTNARQAIGIGDDAAWGSRTIDGKTIEQMMVRVGRSSLIVIMINGLPDNADTMSRAEALATKIVPKV